MYEYNMYVFAVGLYYTHHNIILNALYVRVTRESYIPIYTLIYIYYIYEGEVTGSGDGLDLHACISVRA
jgi:hypothetical protein